MMKLNNRGWGLGMFLAFIFIFFLAIIMIIVVSRQYEFGLVENTNNEVNPNEKVKYVNYEKSVKDASAIYAAKKYSDMSDGETFYVSINNLNVSSAIKNNCDGYSKITKSEGVISHSAYIRCGSYITSGYNSSIVE